MDALLQAKEALDARQKCSQRRRIVRQVFSTMENHAQGFGNLLSWYPEHNTHHFYNKLLIGADVLGRAIRVVVFVLRVPYLARVRSLEGDSWTQKSLSHIRGENNEWYRPSRRVRYATYS